MEVANVEDPLFLSSWNSSSSSLHYSKNSCEDIKCVSQQLIIKVSGGRRSTRKRTRHDFYQGRNDPSSAELNRVDDYEEEGRIPLQDGDGGGGDGGGGGHPVALHDPANPPPPHVQVYENIEDFQLAQQPGLDQLQASGGTSYSIGTPGGGGG